MKWVSTMPETPEDCWVWDIIHWIRLGCGQRWSSAPPTQGFQECQASTGLDSEPLASSRTGYVLGLGEGLTYLHDFPGDPCWTGSSVRSQNPVRVWNHLGHPSSQGTQQSRKELTPAPGRTLKCCELCSAAIRLGHPWRMRCTMPSGPDATCCVLHRGLRV